MGVKSLSANDDLPHLRSIRAPRHPGISDAVCEAYAEAAEVCLSRHHSPPSTRIRIECEGRESCRSLRWAAPNGTAQRSWKNRDDATRDGAYIILLAVVERELGLVALSRADTRTGADYFVGSPHQSDLEEAHRIEISGVDMGGIADVRRRLNIKEGQVARGNGFLPAYAGVVGFRAATVLVSLVNENESE